MTGGESSIGTNNINININDKNSAKKLRRSFSITRNPFRWSRKFKTNNNNSDYNSIIIQKQDEKNLKLNDNDENNRSTELIREGTDSNNLIKNQKQNNNTNYNHKITSTISTTNSNNNNKILRKSSFRKFLSRIAQHVTSVSIGVS